MLNNSDVTSALADLERRQVISRIWIGDHTVWKPDPTEIANRLEWLTVTDAMREQAPALETFANEIRDEGFKHLVLLGMGGSSLGPEVLRQTFGSAPGYPELIVLDSTVPGWVQSVADAVDPAKTLFLVSSKSGSTTEPNICSTLTSEIWWRRLWAKKAPAGTSSLSPTLAVHWPGWAKSRASGECS